MGLDDVWIVPGDAVLDPYFVERLRLRQSSFDRFNASLGQHAAQTAVGEDVPGEIIRSQARMQIGELRIPGDWLALEKQLGQLLEHLLIALVRRVLDDVECIVGLSAR